MNGIEKAIGQKLELFLLWFFALTESELRLLPDRYERWLVKHGFHRTDGRTFGPDYAAFGSWLRSGIIWLLALAFGVEFYAIVLGHSSSLGKVLTAGIVVFGVCWIIWLALYVGKISGKLFLLLALVTVSLSALLLLPPMLQYSNSTPFLFMSADSVHAMVGAGIPRYWAILGFVLVSLVILPLLWTARIGPALVSLAFGKTKDSIKRTIGLLIEATASTPSAERAAQKLQERASHPTSMLLTAWAALALFTFLLLFSPTVWGLFGGLVIGVGSIVVFWLRSSLGFIGNFLTKALYGVATGALIFFCFLYGLSIVVLMLVSAWTFNKPIFGLLAVCLIIGLVSAVMTMFSSTTIAEQNELAAGNVHIISYHRMVKGFKPDGTPEFEAVHLTPKKLNISMAWLQLPIIWIVIAVAAWFYFVGNPIPAILALDFEHMMIAGMALGLALIFLPKLFLKKSAPKATNQTSSHGGH